MRRSGKAYYKDRMAGTVWQDENGYGFKYEQGYLLQTDAVPVNLTLPLLEETYQSNTMMAFFDGLIPEGWLLEIAVKNWKLNQRDRMGLLLTLCKDSIGAVSVSDPQYKED